MNFRVLGPLFACWFSCLAFSAEPIAVPKELKDVPASNFCKVVEGTTSRDGQLAAAVGLLRPGPLDWAKFRQEDGSFDFEEQEDGLANFLVDLRKDRVIAVLDAKHLCTRGTYNHESYHLAWSDDGKFLAETQSWKLGTFTGMLYHLDVHAVISSMDLLPVAEEQLRVIAVKDHKVTRQRFDEHYAVTLSDVAVDSKGKVSMGVSAYVPKEDDPSFSAVMQFTVQVDANGKLTPGKVEMKATKTDESDE